MMAHVGWWRIGDAWGRLVQALRRLARRENGLDSLGSLEGAVQVALPPVRPPARFRESLRENLALAAQRKMSGLVIEYPRPFREGMVLGISVGIAAATAAALVVLLRSRLVRAHR